MWDVCCSDDVCFCFCLLVAMCARVSCYGVVLCCLGVGVANGNILVGWLFSNVGGPMVMCPWVRNVVCVPKW